MSLCLIYIYAAGMTLFLLDFGVTEKVPRGGYSDDVLDTKVSDVTFTSILDYVGACCPWQM